MTKFIIFTAIILLTQTQIFAQNQNYTIKPKILKVYDGDTVLIKTKEGSASVRLTGIDCYETHINYHINYQKREDLSYEEIISLELKGKRALEDILKGGNIEFEITGIDKKYGRFVGVLYKDGVNLNREMLKTGYCSKYIYKARK